MSDEHASNLPALASGLLASPMTSAGDVWNALIGNRISSWYLSNAMKAAKKTQEEAAKLGLRIRSETIPDRFTVAWFEQASRCDDDDLQTLFARLLARAGAKTDDDAPADVRFVGLVAGFGPIEAKAFDTIYSGGRFSREHDRYPPYSSNLVGGYPLDLSLLRTLVEESFPKQGALAIDHLVSAGLLDVSTKIKAKLGGVGRISGSNPSIDFGKIIENRARPEKIARLSLLGTMLYAEIKGS